MIIAFVGCCCVLVGQYRNDTLSAWARLPRGVVCGILGIAQELCEDPRARRSTMGERSNTVEVYSNILAVGDRNSSLVTSHVPPPSSCAQEYVERLGGKRKIEKILIANNGIGAVKAIRSIRRWAYEMFGDERSVQFIVMATPEDLRANAEFIRMADEVVDVPGGSNNNKFYIIQVLTVSGKHCCWTRWGRIGEPGQNSNQACVTLAAAEGK